MLRMPTEGICTMPRNAKEPTSPRARTSAARSRPETPTPDASEGTKLKKPNQKQESILKGELWTCLTIHAKRAFLNPEEFRKLRGTTIFHDSILELGKSWSEPSEGDCRVFETDQEAQELRKNGYAAGVFNQFPLDNEFVPIFKLSTATTSFHQERNNWSSIQLILSRYGYFQILLRKSFSAKTTAQVLGLAQEEYPPLGGKKGIHRQWDTAKNLIGAFVQGCKKHHGKLGNLEFNSKFFENWEKDNENSETRRSDGPDLPLRNLHTVFQIEEISLASRVNSSKEYTELDPEKQLILASILEGVPIYSKEDSTSEARTPELSQLFVDSCFKKNVASWKNEAMLISSDITVIYAPLTGKTVCGFGEKLSYFQYWLTIIRGIAFYCEMRVLAQQLRAESADLLEKTISQQGLSAERLEKHKTLAMLLARLRTASDPATISPGDYAAVKFERISEAFAIRDVVEAAQKNLELLNADFAHKESMSLEGSQALLNIGLAIFAAIAISLEVPPFWQATLGANYRHDILNSLLTNLPLHSCGQLTPEKLEGVSMILSLIAILCTIVGPLIAFLLFGNHLWRTTKIKPKLLRLSHWLASKFPV